MAAGRAEGQTAAAWGFRLVSPRPSLNDCGLAARASLQSSQPRVDRL
jgi:hypothetical protein